ncbi:MAG TPA: hypothetical protein VFQ63_00505 [Patescibacteria group bacterium]|nr:hypothetical protein [Patescibacteria group bacterium]
MAAQEHSHPKSHEVVTLLAWQGPGRPFKKRGKQYFATTLLIMLLIEVILFLFSEYMLMLVVLAFVFLTFAMATVPPHDFHYRISSEGVQVEDHYFLWQELYDFYFIKTYGVDVLHIRTKTFFPGELTITLGDKISVAHIKSVLLPYLPFREYVKPTFMERSATWLSKNFPLEK